MDTTTLTDLAARIVALDEALLAAAAAEGDGGGKPMRTARRLTAELGEAIASLRDKGQQPARPARVAPQPADTAAAGRRLAKEIVTAPGAAAATEVARSASGRLVTAAAQLLGVHVHGTVAARRQQLVEQTIVRQITMAALSTPRRPDGSRDRDATAATVDAWRQGVLAELEG